MGIAYRRRGSSQPRPEFLQFIRGKVRQHLAVHLYDRSERLAGEPNHFLSRRGIGGDVEGVVLNPPIVQPMGGLVAPTAIRLDKKSNVFWFHLTSSQGRWGPEPPR